ncbi:MAG: MASE1 domain-containing protein [Bdellovibrionales bacterium]|nr:MASE1 domain-containing protein [Bdellovibrionales bacterium]
MRGVTFVVAYVLTSKLGYYFALTPSGVSPIWPPAGLALACTILHGYSMLPTVFVGVAVAHALSGMSATATIFTAFGNTLEAGLGAYLCYHLIGKANPLDRPRELSLFLIGPVLLSTMVGAIIGVSALMLTGESKAFSFVSLWRVWWLGDIFGDLVVAPFMLAWMHRPRSEWHFRRAIEAAFLVVLVFGVSKLVFYDWLPPGYGHYPIEHLCIPVLLWATFRFGRRGCTTAILIITTVATLGTVSGFGPYYQGTRIESIHLLQLFIGTTSITMLFVAAVRVQHRSAQIRLKESEALYEAVVQNLPLNIFRKDKDGRVLFANAYYLQTLRRELHEVLGKTDFDLFDLDLAEKYRRDDEIVMFSQHALHTVEKFRAPDGTELYTQVCKVPMKDRHGNTVGTIGAFWDITDQKRIESQLREAKQRADSANLAKTKFLANMSHEMRTPLSAILGFVERMALPERTEAERFADAARIGRSVRNLTELIDDILDLSKIEAGKLKPEKIDFSLLQELEDVYFLLSPQAKDKRLNLHFEFLGPVPVTINTDPHRLRQILLNIIGNALKFTVNGDVRVQISIDRNDPNDLLRILVSDSGCGICHKKKKQLFQPFVQADSSTTRKYGGTGLGLILSRRLARALGGDVTLAQSIPGIGSSFEITIRCTHDKSTPFAEIHEFPRAYDEGINLPPRDPGDLTGLDILLAEDGPDNQELIRFFLTSSGAHVDVAQNGQEALELARDHRYDLVLMDIQMPVVDGYSATRSLRAMGYNVPIVALTAHAMVEDKDRCLNAGCNGYITKPVFRDTLIETVHQFGRKSAAH